VTVESSCQEVSKTRVSLRLSDLTSATEQGMYQTNFHFLIGKAFHFLLVQRH
jgi:hypothetical protein